MSERPFSYWSNLFAGDLSSFGGPTTDETVAGHIRAEQIALVLVHTPSMMLANICNATVLVLALWNSPDALLATLWATVMIVAATFAGLRARRSWKFTKPQTVSRRAIQRLVRNSFVFGSMWAVVPVTFFASAANGGQLVITCLCAGMLAGGAVAFATVPIAAIAFIAPILLGTSICIGKTGDFTYSLVAILVAVYAVMLLRGVLAHSFEFTRRLIDQVRTEKVVRQDTLTALPNRFAFNENLEGALEGFAKYGREFAVALFDLDRFKEINDQFGHPVGDEYLAQVAARLRRCTRENDVVARIGGDEFALIIANPITPEEVLGLVERMAAIFTEPFTIEGRKIRGSTSVGIALAPRDGIKISDLLKHADVALYRAKHTKPGSVRFFEPSDDASARKRRRLQADLEQAIARNELFLVYQPLLDLRVDRVIGFEALLRWRHSTEGDIPPSEFIPIAEEAGLIHAIGEWVIRRACADASHWPLAIRISVNFSAVQFQNVSVLSAVVRALAEARMSPARLEIEITESVLISKYGLAEGIIKALLALGVTIALDDFGTGFSSMTYLRRLPLSRIKIDQSFVRDMLAERDCAAIVKSMIGLARDMGIGVVAEGVETKDQLDFLRHESCDEVQGYLIGRPVPADQIAWFLEQQGSHAA